MPPWTDEPMRTPSAAAQPPARERRPARNVARPEALYRQLRASRGVDPRRAAAEHVRVARLLLANPLDHALAGQALRDALALDPAADGAQAELDRLVEVARTWRADAKALAADAGRARERRAAALLYVEAAALHAAYDGEGAARVIDLCERALLLSPGDGLALDLLERYLNARGEWRRLADALQRLSRALREPQAIAAVQLRLGVLDLVRFGDASLALAAFERALRVDASSAAAAQLAFELHADAGREREALAVLERHLAAVPPRPEHEAWRLYAARVALAAGDERRARRHLEIAHAADPASAAVAAALAPILERAGAWDALAALLDARSAPDLPEPVRRDALARAADVRAARLGQPDEAAERWRRLLELAPDDAQALRGLEAALVQAGRLDDAIAALRRRIERAADPARRRELLGTLADYRVRAGDREGAAAALREAVGLGEDAAALGALAGALAHLGPAAAAERAGVLARWARLLDGADRAAVEIERAALLDADLGQPEEAAAALVEAVAAPDLPRALLERADRALDALLGRGVAPAPVAAALASARERLSDVRGAFAAAAAGLAARADDPDALAACERLARRADALDQLVEILDRAASSLGTGGAADRAEVALRLRAAAIAEQDLGVADEAARQLRRCAALAPEDEGVLAALTRVLLSGERWEELRGVLERRAALAGGAERAALLRQLSAVLLEHGGDAAAALEAAERALAATPPEQRPRLLAHVAEAARAAGDARREAHALAELAATGDGAQARDAARRRARLLASSLGEPLPAIDHFRAALAEDPGDEEARAALEELAGSADAAVASAAWRALLGVAEAGGDRRGALRALEAIAARAADPAERAATERRAAAICGGELGQWSLAVASLGRAVRATPGDATLRAELIAAAARAGAEREAARLIESTLAALGSAEAASAWRDLGRVREERLGDAAGAVAAFAAAAALDPADREARAALVRLHRAMGRDAERVEACLALADVAASDPERIACWREAAQVLDERLGDAARAAELWGRVAAATPDDDAAQEALDDLLVRLDRPADLIALLERRRARRADDAELAVRLAALQARTGAAACALATLEAVFRTAPAHAGARAVLRGLVTAPGVDGRRALAALDPLLREEGEHAGRVMAREQRLAVIDDPVERTRLHGEVRAILERELGRPELALAAAARAFAEGGAAALDAEGDLVRLAEATGRMDALADALEACAATAAPEEASQLLRRAARVRTDRGEDVRAALAAWERLRAVLPEDDEALAALEALHARAGDADAAEAAARLRAARHEGAARADVLLRAAATLEGIGDVARAAALAEDAHAAYPAGPDALAYLARLHRATGDRAGLARALRAQADGAGDVAGRMALLLERARVLEDGEDGEEALHAYAEIVAEDRSQRPALEGIQRLLGRGAGTREAAARILEEVYRGQGDARRLAALLARRLEHADPAERGPLLAEIAVLHERLGDRAEAFRVRARALREASTPGHGDAALLADLERLAADAGAFDELAAAYEEALARGLPDAAREDARRRLAAVYADRLGRLDDAARTLEALARDVADPEVLAALARVHRRRGAHADLVRVLRRSAELASAPDVRKDLLLEVASTLEQQLSDREGAMEAYRQILSVDPEDPNALRLLGDALGAAERWEELVEVLGREVDVAERRPNLVAEAAELRFRLGRIRHQRLADTAGALQCYRGVLERVPRHPAVLAALEELARGGGPVSAEAATLLEPVYEQEREYPKLIEAIEVRAAAAADARDRTQLLRRIARVRSAGLRDAEGAFLAAARAVREDPDDAASITLAAELAEAAGLHEELAALLSEVADRLHEPAARVELRRQVAHVTARAGDPRRTADAWDRLLEVSPEDDEALAGLAEAHRATGDAGALAQALRRRSSVVGDPATRAAVLAELAEIQHDRQQDRPAAMGTVRRWLEIEPSHRGALARLDRLCVETEKWVELADVLGREVATSEAAGDADAALAFRRRLAELKDTRLLDREGALDLYDRILAARPDDAAALERVEALLQRDPGNARASSLLERAYAATGAWARYAAVMEMRAAERPDPVERKALFLELAEIQERRLGSPELAFIALCRAFRDDPSDPALRGELQRLASASGHAEELAALYEDEFDELPPAVGAEVALALGGLYERQLGDPRAAIGWLERARRIDPATAGAALAGLDRLYRDAGDHAALADVLDAEAALAAADDRAAFLYRLGQLCEEHLQDPARAARAYQALVAEQPAHGAALRALERIHEAEGRLDALAENLAAQRELATDAAARLRLTARLAATTQALGDAEGAIALWREAVGVDPRHEAALAALEALYEQLHRWPELTELLRARVALTADRREAARLHEKLAVVLATRLGDAAQAVRAYQGVLDTDPRNRRALEALRDLHEAQGDLDALASVYRRLLPLQDDAAGVKAIRLQLADALLRAGKKGEAAEQGRRALELEPHDDAALERLARVLEAAGAPQDAVRAVESRAASLAAAGRAADAVAAWVAAADTWERELAKPEAACAALEKVLELEPARRDAWSRLKDLYARAGDWRAYVRVSDLFTPHLDDPAERLATLADVAEVHEKRLGQKDMAFITWCRAFGEAPFDPAVAAAVGRLAGETQAWEELAAVHEQVAEEATGTAQARLLLELGRVRDLHLDDADGAEAAFRRALEVDPANAQALDALTDLFTRRGRVRDLVIALEQKLEAAAGLEEKKATLTEMARIYEGQLQDPGEAITALKRVLELDGADAAALEALAGLYRRQGRWGDLAGILARTRDQAGDPAVRLACQLQVAALHENELADDEAAVQAYRAALAIDDRARDALAGLERLYTKLDRWAELNGVYERQVELAADPRERVRILGKSAAIWEEKLHDPRRAIEQNEAVLAHDPSNATALTSLEALYRRERQPEKLIEALQHHAALTRDPRETVSLEVQIGEVWWKDLGRADRAEALFTHALQLDPESRATVSALARLHEENGSWNLALEMLQREARLAVGGAELVDIQARIARIQQEHLQDRQAAKIAYARALDADPGHLPSLRALRAIAAEEGDRDAYLRLLLSEARYTERDEDKAALLHEAGRIHQEERDDPDGAVRLYEEALRKVPDDLVAARPLADLYVARGDWARAGAVLDVIVGRLSVEGDPQELCRQCYRLGYVAEKLGDRAKALQAQRRAYELDATYLPALESLGALLVQDEAWEEALRIYQAILIHHRDGLTDLEVVETHWQIGDLQARLGQLERAANSFEKALEVDAGHERARRGLIAVLDRMGDWEAAVDHRRKLLPFVEGPAKRDVYVAIGTVCRDRLQDSFQAADAFTAAARIDPDPEVIDALLALYRETRQGQKAADVLGRLLESPDLREDPARAARLHHTLAATLRDELHDPAGAARELERALDADPGMVQAFADLEALLSAAQDWRALEQAYVRMIQRLPKGPQAASARLALWKALGELYRRVLHDPENARMAFEVVAKGDPDDAAAVEAHAELAAQVPGHDAEAIGAYRRLLVVGGAPRKALSALVRLHAERKAFDEAYSTAQALAFLQGGASTEEAQVVSRLRRFAREAATGTMDEALWEKLLHERARGPMGAILALLVRDASELFVQEPRELGITPRRSELDVAGSMLFFANMYKYVARVLGIPLPRLFRAADAGSGLRVVPLRPPALVAGEELFKERPKKELWFAIGKAMTFLRPELMLARFMPHDQLDALFQAAASLGTSRFAVSADPHLVEKLKRRLENVLPESSRTQTLKVLARSYCDVQRPGDVRGYMDAAELTSNRVGAVLAGDLDVVRKMLAVEKAAVSKLREEVRLRDLVLFCTSPEYAAVREQLGTSVVVPA